MTVHVLAEHLWLAGDRSVHAIEGGSVGELLAELERAYPAAKGWILDERGVLRRHINVFVNGELGGQDTQVGRDDEVDVLPAISGGSLPLMLASVDGTIGPAEEARILLRAVKRTPIIGRGTR